jgi:lysophospholipase L1-like esterase
MKTIRRFAKAVARTLAITTALFLILNVVSFMLIKLVEMRATRQQPQDVHADFFSEAGRLRLRWMPYSYWICKPFTGKSLNVDSGGLRHTWHNGLTSPYSTGKRMFRIFMFGGSTMFGWVESDDYTIPSAVVKALTQRGIGGVEVINFGQLGYVNTQELILLLEQLRQGNIPDLVILYDGYNDTFSAFQNGKAGITENEVTRAREFNSMNTYLPEVRRRLYGFVAKLFVSRLAIVKLAVICIQKFVPDISSGPSAVDNSIWNSQHLDKGAGIKQLPQSVAKTYLDNLRLISEAGKRKGFKTLFYWQPTAFSKARWSPEEARMIAMDPQPKSMERFFKEVYRAVHAMAGTEPHEMYNLGFLDDVIPAHVSCYIDLAHVTRECNDIIARRIAGDAIRIIDDTRGNRNISEPRQE